MKILPSNPLVRGIISGVSLTMLVAVATFAGVHVSRAQGEDPVWQDGSASVSQPAAAPKTAAANTGAYVALGDSVATGLGLPTWTTATAEDKRCGRSPEAYVFEAGRQLKRPHAPYACKGATSADILNRTANSAAGSQLDLAFAQGKPAVISITVGANDISWEQTIERCAVSSCGGKEQTDAVNAALVRLQANLSNVMRQIESRSAGQPPVVVLTGYYNPVSVRCTALSGGQVKADEIAWIGSGVKALNTTISDVAASYGSFARYAAVDFSGHDLCSGDSWIQNFSSKAPLHPTAAGQQAIARSVVQAVNSRQ